MTCGGTLPAATSAQPLNEREFVNAVWGDRVLWEMTSEDCLCVSEWQQALQVSGKALGVFQHCGEFLVLRRVYCGMDDRASVIAQILQYA
jgi:hypothetical protein